MGGASAPDGVVVPVELAGGFRVERDGLDGGVLGTGEGGQTLEHLLLPQVHRHGERRPGKGSKSGIARLRHAVRRRGQDVVRDALHVVARIEDDASPRGLEPDPFAAPAIHHLEALHPRGRQQREEVDVFVAQEAAGARGVVVLADRRVVVQAKPEVGSRQPSIVQVRVLAQGGENRLHHGNDEPLVLEAEPTEEGLHFRAGPELAGADRVLRVEIECPPAEHPSLHEIGMDVGGLLDGKVTLVHGAVAL